MTTTRTDTVAHIFDSMTNDERWLGWGYLGARRRFLNETDPEWLAEFDGPDELVRIVAETDKFVLDYALAQGWSREDLFQWANSRYGRHYADSAFGGRPDSKGALTCLRVPRDNA